jgi:hypothetical protein
MGPRHTPQPPVAQYRPPHPRHSVRGGAVVSWGRARKSTGQRRTARYVTGRGVLS